MSTPRTEALEKLLGIIDRLREPDGCPWDREQTVATMAEFVLEEGFELVEAIETGDDSGTMEELGDLLMVLLMICRIADEGGRFDISRAASTVSEKLIRRHPHVFGEAEVKDSREVLANWEAIKKTERVEEQKDASALAGVPLALPALQRADRLCEKAVSAGFRWNNAAGAWAKLEEEVGELRTELEHLDLESSEPVKLEGELRERVEAELGDLLLAGAFLGTYLELDPEKACRAALRRFEKRFRRLEEDLGGNLSDRSLEELIAAWGEAKRHTAHPG
jgi:tetrapyrrole methylase family protein / MazG family protein